MIFDEWTVQKSDFFFEMVCNEKIFVYTDNLGIFELACLVIFSEDNNCISGPLKQIKLTLSQLVSLVWH